MPTPAEKVPLSKKHMLSPIAANQSTLFDPEVAQLFAAATLSH